MICENYDARVKGYVAEALAASGNNARKALMYLDRRIADKHGAELSAGTITAIGATLSCLRGAQGILQRGEHL